MDWPPYLFLLEWLLQSLCARCVRTFSSSNEAPTSCSMCTVGGELAVRTRQRLQSRDFLASSWCGEHSVEAASPRCEASSRCGGDSEEAARSRFGANPRCRAAWGRPQAHGEAATWWRSLVRRGTYWRRPGSVRRLVAGADVGV
jgi:hypothetical protein